MSELPPDLRYTNDHEWVRPEGKALQFVAEFALFGQKNDGDV